MTHPAYGVVRPVTPYAGVLLAANPSPMTLDGTNTWLLGGVVVDPGPEDAAHLAAIAAAGPVREILLTHGHADHAEGARALHELTGAPVRALDPALRYGGEGLSEGDVVAGDGVEIRVVATPGHTADSLTFLANGSGVLTGDTILGTGTTVVAHPDGRLADYLASLRRLAALGAELGPLRVLPGHGPELPDLAPVVAAYQVHRQQRLDQIRDALATLGADASASAVVELVYADVDRSVWWAAELSVRAQLDYLRRGPGGPAAPGPG
jgi:glyoxylase-like metal-dependent hydrolase (beta-lactamase superfamily II)